MMIDPESLDLAQGIEAILGDLGDDFIERVKPELMQSVLEIATPVCKTAGDVDRELRKLRAYVTSVAAKDEGARGDSPASDNPRQGKSEMALRNG